MLQFLQGWLWIFGAVAALPIILHILSRQRLRKVRFSSLMLIARLEKSQMRRLRLRQLLLLIIRTLTVLALVLAFTRPLLRDQRLDLPGDEETAAVLVVDGSASMSALGGDGRRIDVARAAARRVIAALGPGDRLAMVADTGGTGAVRYYYGKGEWQELIDNATASDHRADLGAAVGSAFAALDSLTGGVREIYVITDGQHSSWRSPLALDSAGIRTYLIDLESDLQPNRSLRQLDFGPSLWVAHAPLEVSVSVTNTGPDIRDLPVSLFLDGSRLAQQAVSIRSGDSDRVTLRIAELSPGWHYGRVEISSDAWPADNVIHFALEAATSLPVLVTGNNRDLVVPVRAALRPKPETRTPFEPESVGAAAFASEVDPRYGLVVLAGVESIPPLGWERLLRYVRNGGGLWVLLDPNNDRANYNRHLLEPVWNSRLESQRLAHTGGSFVTLEKPAIHALFRYLESVPAYPEIRFRGAAVMSAVAPDLVLQRFSDGSPALLEASLDRGRIVLLTGFASPDQSDLVYHPLFVPAVQSTATYLARRRALGARTAYLVGERPPGLAETTGDWRWVTPAADTLALPGGPLMLPTLAGAGVHTLLKDSKPVAYYAANLDPAELNLEHVETWRDVWARTPFTRIAASEEIGEQIAEARLGIELWYPALILALLLLLVEMLVAWPRRSEREPLPPSASG